MAPRRAAAVSAASSISQAAGPSSHAQSGKEAAQGRQSLDAQKQSTKAPPMLPIVPIQPLSPIVIRLRKMWKFAAICQFLFTFDEAFGMSGFETEVSGMIFENCLLFSRDLIKLISIHPCRHWKRI